MKSIFQLGKAAPFALALLFAAPGAIAHEGIDHSGEGALSGTLAVGDIAISGAFARATLPNAPVGGGFMTIANQGDADDRLVGAESEVAAEVQLHEMRLSGDVMEMRALDQGIPIPAGETVTLAPGGLHVMFMGLGQPFIEGECVLLTLAFERAGTAEFCMPIGPAAARGAAEDHEHTH